MSLFVYLSLFFSAIHLSYQQTCSFSANTATDAPYFAVFTMISTADECCGVCNNNPNCQLYTFVACNDGTRGKCYLKSSVGNSYNKANRFSGLRGGGGIGPTPAPTPAPTVQPTTKASVCVDSADTNYPGNDIPNQGFGSVASQQDCCNLCGANPGCTAYSYSSADKYCWLKNPSI